jgi:alkanesulfonate monooxygenase SsuD/methylene tetrahydromethanopterin reductase-like flavin-dependent oxidoreductase (luciferase family)
MAHAIKFGVVLPLTDFAAARSVAQQAEAFGFHTIAAEDHFFMTGMGRDRSEPRMECFTLLSALAPLTERITLTQIVTANSFRHPALLAKIISTLHHISGGLWADESPSFTGDYYRITNAPHAPKPRPRPRIMLGGGGPKLLRVAATEADVVNIIPPSGGAKGKIVIEDALKFDEGEFRRRVDLLADSCKSVGRDFSTLELSGMVYVLAGRTDEEADAMARMTAQMMGLGIDDLSGIRRSPSTLVGTPAQIAEEIRRRARELGVTYYFCNFLAPEMFELFGREVLPLVRGR